MCRLLLAVEIREIKSCPPDTWCSFAATDEVEAGGVDNTGLPPPGEIQLQRHLEEHEGRVDAVLVQLQHVAQRGQPSLGCRGSKTWKQAFTSDLHVYMYSYTRTCKSSLIPSLQCQLFFA